MDVSHFRDPKSAKSNEESAFGPLPRHDAGQKLDKSHHDKPRSVEHDPNESKVSAGGHDDPGKHTDANATNQSRDRERQASIISFQPHVMFDAVKAAKLHGEQSQPESVQPKGSKETTAMQSSSQLEKGQFLQSYRFSEAVPMPEVQMLDDPSA
jgi:hypothetical protein